MKGLSSEELLDLANIAKILGYSGFTERYGYGNKTKRI